MSPRTATANQEVLVDQQAFRSFVREAAIRAVRTPHVIGRLVLTQTEPNGEPKLREPEMRHALAQEAEARGDLNSGIEVPTVETYRFVDDDGDRETSARHDFAVFGGNTAAASRLVLLELKKDQPDTDGSSTEPDCPKVRKDFQKLILERAQWGKAMLHILHAADHDSVPAVLQKYNAGIKWALRLAAPVAAARQNRDPLEDGCWFTLFILVVRRRRVGNTPALNVREFARFGDALRRVHAGDDLFRRDEEWRDLLEEA